MMKIAFGSDEKTQLTDFLITHLKELGHELKLLGHVADEKKKWRWVEVGTEVGRAVAQGQVDQGIALCWSGTGVCMAANKVRRARAALCWDGATAAMARKWDDANVLCLSLRFTSETVAKEILQAWFSTAFDEENLNEARKLDSALSDA